MLFAGRSRKGGYMGLLKVCEAASVLRCSEPTVRNLISGGEIKAVRVGRLVRIDIAELKRFVNGTHGVETSRLYIGNESDA